MVKNIAVHVGKKRAGQGQGTQKALVRQMIRGALVSVQETKVRNTLLTGQTAAIAGTVWAITQGIVQGDTISQRSGSVIVVKKLGVSLNAFITTVTAALRVIVVSDTHANSAIPTVSDVLDSASYLAGRNGINIQNKRFNFLYDRRHSMCAGGSNQQLSLELDFPLRTRVAYTGTTDVAAANGTNSFYFIILADTAALVTYSFNFHMQYTDS